ncbi:MAG: hypothetical protein PHI34_02810 [Acidobacteriota bacterium]|nr:hypothetical protein [Acidobacteriota bacterium]
MRANSKPRIDRRAAIKAAVGLSFLLALAPGRPASSQDPAASSIRGIGWTLRLGSGPAGESAGSLAVWTPESDAAAVGTLIDLRVRAAADETGLEGQPFLPYRAAGSSTWMGNNDPLSFPEEDFSGLSLGRSVASEPDQGMFVWLTTLRNRRKAPLAAEIELAVDLRRDGSNRKNPAAPCLEGGDGSAPLWSELEDPSDGRLWSVAWGGPGARIAPEIGQAPDASLAFGPGRTNRRYKIKLEPGESAAILTVVNEGLGQAASSSTADLLSTQPGRLAVELAAANRAPVVNFPSAALSTQDGVIVEYIVPAHLSWVKPPVTAQIKVHNPELVTADEHYFRFEYYIDMGHWDALYERLWDGPLVSDYAYSWTPQDWLNCDYDEFRCVFYTGGPQAGIIPRFAIDRASPQAAILSPQAGDELNADLLPVSFEGRDNIYVRWLSLEVDGRTVWEKDTPGQAFMRREHDEGSWDWNLRQEPIGKHALTVRVRDGAGWSAAKTIEVEIQGVGLAVVVSSTFVPLPPGGFLLAAIRFEVDNPRRLPVARYRILRRIADGVWEGIKDFADPSLDQASFVWLDRIAGKAPAGIRYKIEALDAQGALLGSSPEAAAD